MRKRTGLRQALVGTALGGALLTWAPAAGIIAAAQNDQLFEINKSIDLFGRVYKEITLNYVDPVDPERFMRSGIDGMLGTLDPYTVYIARDEGDDVDLMTSGRYAGIGVTIGLRDGGVRVVTVMDGYAAQRQGILPGDRFLEVDSVKIEGHRVEDVRNLTRGEPGTKVRVLVEREGSPGTIEFVLVREEILVKNVTYAGFVEDGFAYLRVDRFSRNAGEEVRHAIRSLKADGKIRGLILDLRGNPGGLLDAAVDVSGQFLPRGSLVVSTRGRQQESEKKYHTNEEPLLPETPIVVLTDRASASASEIVAGSLQDLDRAVILGERTFGKGLVQTIVPLQYGSQLKITTARYYTPSGRCIQEIDYLHRDRHGVFTTVPDSLRRRYRTANGRPVYEYGGITPDSVVAETDAGPMVREIQRRSLFFTFINRVVGRGGGDSNVTINDSLMRAFRAFLDEENFTYRESGEGHLEDLRTAAKAAHFSPEVLEDIGRLEASVTREKSRGFDRYRDHIENVLRIELMARLRGVAGRIEASFPSDAQLRAAIGILKNARAYAATIGPRGS